jgi:DNA-binding IclR family transcriptional regulator
VLLAYADAEVVERVFAKPLRAVSAETITDAAVLRRTLADVRRRGHVVSPGSIERVSTGVAVPVRDERGRVIAALSVVLPRDSGAEAAAIEELTSASAGITKVLSRRRE